ncbi:MAG: HAMP domain-containing protein [Candidatus Aminicenantes bacterium]|nr:HAMP domain-containing protein [Candidatus Aminicenantes bacterium]
MKSKNIKGVRLIVAAMVLFFIVFVILRLYFEESKNFSPLALKDNTVIFGLWIIIILFGLTFLFILARNILKMYLEKNQGGAGHSFKNRLVFFFIAFSIVPTLLLFFFATDVISQSIEQWFKTPIESIMKNVEDVKTRYYGKITEDLEHFSGLIAAMIQQKRMYTDDNKIFLQNRLREKMLEYKLDVVNIYRNRNETFSLIHPRIPIQEYKDLPLNIVYRGLGGAGFTTIDTLKTAELIRNGVAIDIERGDKMLIITGKYFPESYTRSLNALAGMVRKHSQMRMLRDPVKNTYILLFLFITVLIIFSASWLGFYLAKGITVPIEKLVAATSEIAKGNLDVRIDYETKDEFNTLINEFNRMALDLKENRDKLTRRTIELRHRRSIIETILKNITSGVMALNAHGDIMAINPEAARMLSLDAESATRKNYAVVIPETIFQDIHAMIRKAFETRFKLIEKEIDVKVEGKYINLAVKITQLRSPINNRFAGLLVVLTDLTELIKAQRMLVWREVAKRIAHEIKNPLTPIQISSQRIQRSLEQPPEKFRAIVEDSLNIISQELDSIKNLAEEFANFARLPEIKFSQGDINEILEKLLSVYTSIYQNVQFKVQLDVNMPPLVKLDVEQIKRVLVNILDNALEVIGKEGEIGIATSYNPESKFVTIEIADSGPGIPDEEKQKVFLPYFSKKSSGTGLGLAIAHNIVEEHNGMISISDNQPHGARFVIELPA